MSLCQDLICDHIFITHVDCTATVSQLDNNRIHEVSQISHQYLQQDFILKEGPISSYCRRILANLGGGGSIEQQQKTRAAFQAMARACFYQVLLWCVVLHIVLTFECANKGKNEFGCRKLNILFSEIFSQSWNSKLHVKWYLALEKGWSRGLESGVQCGSCSELISFNLFAECCKYLVLNEKMILRWLHALYTFQLSVNWQSGYCLCVHLTCLPRRGGAYAYWAPWNPHLDVQEAQLTLVVNNT